MKKTVFTILFFCLLFIYSQAGESLLRYPAIDPSGKNLAFSFQGDIWVMNFEQQIPIRLTIHPSYDSYPTWSPDGKMIAFSSNRFGSEDVFVMNADGSSLKRLTFYPSNDKVNSWNLQDRIVFETRRLDAQVEREQEIFYVSPNGGNPQKLMEALGSDAVESPDGSRVAFVRGSCRITRQAYEGSANRNIWLFDKKSQEYTQLTFEDFNQFQPNWKNNEELLFISSNGTNIYQLMSLKLKEKKALINQNPLTQFKDYGLRYYSFASQSDMIAMESGDDIFIQKPQENKLLPIDLAIQIENRENNVEHKTYQGDVSSFQVSPNGKYLVTTIHGNIFVTQAKDKDNFTRTLTNDSYNNTNPVWLNDTTILFVSDKKGQQDIYLLKSSDANESDIFKSLKHEIKEITNSIEDEDDLVISNNGDKIAYLRGEGTLVVAEINSDGKMSNEILLLDSWAPPSSVCWSPDDQYLAYSKSDLDFNREVYIHKADNSIAPVNISMHPRNDVSPSWSPDGKKLVFSSIRNYGNYDIWYVWLQKKDWEKTMDEWKLEETPKEDIDKKKKKSVEVKIDFDNIYNRLYQLTSLPGNEDNPLFSEDGKTIYFNSNSNEKGKTDLYKINWDKKDIKELTKDGQAGRGMELSKDGKYIYMLARDRKPSRLIVSNDKIEKININANADLNHSLEREEIFNQAWKAINNYFYDPDFHGKDWSILKKKYKPIALKASTDDDFYDIFNWMLGEINASHMGIYGPRNKADIKENTALLGISFSAEKNGLRVTRVLKDSPADKQESKLLIGDIITQINHIKVTPDVNFYEMLMNKADQPTIFNISRDGQEKEIVIIPTSSLNEQKYNDWVDFNSKLVDKYSNGKLGYLHIKAMGWPSFERFERDLMAAGYGKEGILIDVRNNGGGFTTDYLMAVLNVKQHSYTIPRGAAENLEKEHKKFREHYAFGERLPFASWTKPSIALCNQNSYSNAEIFSHAYKSNELGTLVGTPTFGAVISTSARTLINGGTIRIPYRGWYVKSTDLNMELNPAVPDVIVDILPDSRVKGKDEQLEKAVEILLKQIDSNN